MSEVALLFFLPRPGKALNVQSVSYSTRTCSSRWDIHCDKQFSDISNVKLAFYFSKAFLANIKCGKIINGKNNKQRMNIFKMLLTIIKNTI